MRVKNLSNIRVDHLFMTQRIVLGILIVSFVSSCFGQKSAKPNATPYYEFLRAQEPEDPRIVLINIEQLDRLGLADEINAIRALGPKVIALDINFVDLKGEHDASVVSALRSCQTLVMPSTVVENDDHPIRIDSKSHLIFSTPNVYTGFTDCVLEEDDLQTLKMVTLWEKIQETGEEEFHFSVQVVMLFDSLKTMHFVNTHAKRIDVDYKRGLRKFKQFSANEVLNGVGKRADVEGKIVLLGFLGPGNEDKFFTPLNTRIEPYEPDMYGVEFLANIVAQILE